MRRQEISNQIRQLTYDLEVTGLPTTLQRLIRSISEREADATEDFMESYTRFSNIASNYSREQKEILSILGFDDILASSFILKVFGISKEDGDQSEILFEANRRIHYAIDFLPRLSHLIASSERDQFHLPNEERSDEFIGLSILSVVMVEDHHGETNPKRVVLLMEAIGELYEASCRLHGLKNEKLAILSVDSGSDKGFDFTGLGTAIEQVKDVILGLFDRMIAMRTASKTEMLDTVERTLPTLQKLKESEKNGDISRSEASQIRKMLLSGIEKFSEVHATIPEMQTIDSSEVRQIVKREIKMIEGPKSEEKAPKKKKKRSSRPSSKR